MLLYVMPIILVIRGAPCFEIRLIIIVGIAISLANINAFEICKKCYKIWC
jgi:hypothetical protein